MIHCEKIKISANMYSRSYMMPQDNSSDISRASKGGSRIKLYAVIAVVVVVVAGIAVFAYYHQLTQSTGTATVVSAASIANYNVPYNVSIKTSGKFNSLSLYWGDGNGSPQTVRYNGSNSIALSHTYTSPGAYYIYFTASFPTGNFTSNKELIPVGVSAATSALPASESYGNIALQSASSPAIFNNSWIYKPGTALSLLLGYFTPPANSSYKVVNQSLLIVHNGSKVAEVALPYYFNNTTGLYELPLSKAIYNLSLSAGYYLLELRTYTGLVNSSSGSVDTSHEFNTSYYTDIPVFSTAAEYTTSLSSLTSFINAEAEVGGYVTLDPQVALDSVSGEVIFNTMATLVDYNGSNSSAFHAYLAAYLPTVANGGINSNWANYTVHVNSTAAGYSGIYNVTIQPYENYTFHLRSNATFADGNKVTAWDVAFSIIRDLLYVAGTPPTPGGQIAPYLLPGNYYQSNTFWNLTQNITWDNATNNVTFHFQSPITPSLVFETLGKTVGTPIVEASWVQSHGGGIVWTSSGFKAYQESGSAGSYISYLENHIMASGPYMIDFTVPASETVLIANPAYNPPGNGWNPKPKIGMIILEYLSQESTQYLQLKSGYATAAYLFPTSSWYSIEPLQKSGEVFTYSFPSSAMEFYSFNTQINETLLSGIDPQANVPQTFFDSVQVRRAFADSYDYSYYLAQQVGNSVYNTSFGTGYAGAIPNGVQGYQSNQSLRASDVSLPGYNLAYAQQNWTAFTQSPYFAKDGLSTSSTGTVIYNGAPLNIPIIVLAGDSVNTAGASTWEANLAKIVPGATFTVLPVSLPQLFSFLAPGQNPAPVWWLEFGGLYPSPSQYIPILAYPSVNSVIPGPNGFYPAWFNSSDNPLSGLPGMVEQYNNLTQMATDFLVGFTTGNPSVSAQHYRSVNEMVVNMTFYVPLFQPDNIYIINSHITPSSFVNYNENTFAYTQYNYLTYS